MVKDNEIERKAYRNCSIPKAILMERWSKGATLSFF